MATSAVAARVRFADVLGGRSQRGADGYPSQRRPHGHNGCGAVLYRAVAEEPVAMLEWPTPGAELVATAVTGQYVEVLGYDRLRLWAHVRLRCDVERERSASRSEGAEVGWVLLEDDRLGPVLETA